MLRHALPGHCCGAIHFSCFHFHLRVRGDTGHWAILLCCMLWGCLSLQAGEPISARQIYRNAQKAGVEILVEGRQSGSGCLVSGTGLILTAAHVIPLPDRRIEVLSPVLGRIPARFVALDLGHDLMLLQVEMAESPKDLPHLSLAETMPEPGENALLFSSAVFRHAVLQRGMIAREGLTFEHQGNFIEVTHIAAMVQEGTSGGPWLNTAGEIVGVQSGSISTRNGPGGVANVAPITAIRSLMTLRQNAATSTLRLFVDEVWVLPPEMLKRFPPATEGVVIQGLQKDGPAEQAGLKLGEVITKIDDTQIRFRDDFVGTFRNKKPGEAVSLTIVSPEGTGTRTVNVTLGELEVGWPNGSQVK